MGKQKQKKRYQKPDQMINLSSELLDGNFLDLTLGMPQELSEWTEIEERKSSTATTTSPSPCSSLQSKRSPFYSSSNSSFAPLKRTLKQEPQEYEDITPNARPQKLQSQQRVHHQQEQQQQQQYQQYQQQHFQPQQNYQQQQPFYMYKQEDTSLNNNLNFQSVQCQQEQGSLSPPLTNQQTTSHFSIVGQNPSLILPSHYNDPPVLPQQPQPPIFNYGTPYPTTIASSSSPTASSSKNELKLTVYVVNPENRISTRSTVYRSVKASPRKVQPQSNNKRLDTNRAILVYLGNKESSRN